MDRVESADGTTIAYDRLGSGDPIVVVAGAMCDRAKVSPTAKALAEHFTVFNFDRRGRGDSGDTQPYAVDREIEDLAAVIEAAGGSAAVYGHSSGAALALRAAAAGLPITRLVLHEPPYGSGDDEEREVAKEVAVTIRSLLGEGRDGDAMATFMKATSGADDDMIEQWRTEDWWISMERYARTIAYDSEVMNDLEGATVPTGLASTVDTTTLVLVGGATFEGMLEVGKRLVENLSHGSLQVLEGQDHNPPPEVLAPVVAKFVLG